uniref:Ig-like domain-containing protein n=1 Tax=Gouania willdenowi TaxID=441366 RepID=A0A8C5G030_GOUWI
MMLMLKVISLLLLLHCGCQTFGLEIQSDPGVNGDGVVQVDLEKTVSLVCAHDSTGSGTGEDEHEELVWLRNGAEVALKDENRKGHSSVCVTPVIHEDNRATFTCHLRGNTSVRTSVTLDVIYLPQLSGSEHITVENEAMLVLQCDIWANPPVSSVKWTMNGTAVDLVGGGFILTNDGFKSQLAAGSVEESLHQGTYQCMADGKYSKLFHVTVTEKTMKFPLYPMIAAVVVVSLTTILAVVARWKRIVQVNKTETTQ